ncbi:MAG: hypothetical protein ACQESB_03845 [Elusimicrobiota bacterium]
MIFSDSNHHYKKKDGKIYYSHKNKNKAFEKSTDDMPEPKAKYKAENEISDRPQKSSEKESPGGLQGILSNRKQMLSAFIFSEILKPPKSR